MTIRSEEEIRQLKRAYEDYRLELLRWMPRFSVGAEIGTWMGDYAAEMISICRPSELHLIDPYQFSPEYPNRWYGGKLAKSQADMDEIYENVREKLEKLAGDDTKITFHKDLSENVLPCFADNELDWAYIDGNHSYEFVKKDLEGLMPKIKPGGFIMGDDLQWPGVARSVQEFIEKHRGNLVVVVVRPELHQFVLKKI